MWSRIQDPAWAGHRQQEAIRKIRRNKTDIFDSSLGPFVGYCCYKWNSSSNTLNLHSAVKISAGYLVVINKYDALFIAKFRDKIFAVFLTGKL